METRELLSILHHIRALYDVGGAKTAEKDLANLIGGLQAYGEETLDSLVEKLSALASPASKVATKVKRDTTASPSPKTLNDVLISEFLQELVGAGLDQDRFARAFSTVSAHPGIKMKEADAIARQFTRRPSPFKTKKAALTAIQQAFVERARFENKLRAVS